MSGSCYFLVKFRTAKSNESKRNHDVATAELDQIAADRDSATAKLKAVIKSGCAIFSGSI